MRQLNSLYLGLLAGILLFGTGCNFNHPKAVTAPNETSSNAAPSTYNRLQNELFNASCASCHNPGRSSGGVDLTSYGVIAKGRTQAGDALLVPGKSSESLVYTIILEGAMPPNGPINPSLLPLLACWIDQGALQNGSDTCQQTAIVDNGVIDTPGSGETPPLVEKPNQPDPIVENPQVPVTPETPPEPSNPDTSAGPETPSDPELPTQPETPVVTLQPSYPLVVSKLITPTCLRCHNERRPSGGIDLSTYAKMKAGVLSDGSSLLNPGSPQTSGIVTVIEQGIMPPSGVPIAQDVQDLLRCWISAGASETAGDACATGATR